jgi:hypothetical protein
MPSHPFVHRLREMIALGRQMGGYQQLRFDAITKYPTLTNKVNLTIEQVVEDMIFMRKMNYMEGSLTLSASEDNFLAAAKEVIDAHFASQHYKYIRSGTVANLKILTTSPAIYCMTYELNKLLNKVVLGEGKLSASDVYKVLGIMDKNFERLQGELE